MKIRKGLKLRKIGSCQMVVKPGSKADLTDVYTLNGTAAWLWQKASGTDFTPEMMAGWLCDEYDVDRDTAEHDTAAMLEDWKKAGLLQDSAE